MYTPWYRGYTKDKDSHKEAKRRKRHSTKNSVASESDIIPEAFDSSGSRLLVKTGHYNAICVTDQRAWRERVREYSPPIGKQGSEIHGKMRFTGEPTGFVVLEYKYLLGFSEDSEDTSGYVVLFVSSHISRTLLLTSYYYCCCSLQILANYK